MRLVYQTAQRVIIWLGPSDSSIDCLFDWMNALDQQVLAIARPHTISTWENQWLWLIWNLRGQPPSDEIREALSTLLRREWFSRIWVLQEAALARSAMVTCGRNEINSRAFVVMPSLLNVDCGEGEQARLDILPGLLREKSWWAASSGKDLLTLLQKFGRSKASDHRDIIYALLGLSGDTHSSELLRPDYQISVEETVRQALAYFMLQTRCLSGKTPIPSSLDWGIDEFLEKLYDLSFHVFKWAADHAQDALLYDLIVSQKNILLAQPFKHPYMDYRSTHGPVIMIAMKTNNSALIDLILTIPGMDIRGTDSEGKTPMSLAMDEGNIAVARLISEYRRQNIDEKRLDHNPAQAVADETESLVIGKVVLDNRRHRRSVVARFFIDDSPLLSATKRGDWPAVESTLSQYDVDLSITDRDGDGPLNIAARRGDEHAIDLLLQVAKQDLGALNIRGSDGLTPFESAIVSYFPGVVNKLLVFSMGVVDDALKENQFQTTGMILGADPRLAESECFDYENPLSCAAYLGYTDFVSFLLDNGADINSRDCGERAATPLWIAALRGNIDTVKVLVERGANIKLRVNEGAFETTALWAAASNGYTRLPVVMYLLEVGAQL